MKIRNLFLMGMSILILVILTGCPVTSGHDMREAEVETSLRAIQVDVERWALDHENMYPQDINVVVISGIAENFPSNPISEGEMIPIEFGSEPFEGNFTYVPVSVEGDIKGYYLIGYGLSANDGDDIDGDGTGDHVVAVLKGWNGDESDIPPLEDLL